MMLLQVVEVEQEQQEVVQHPHLVILYNQGQAELELQIILQEVQLHTLEVEEELEQLLGQHVV
jgi:hypothetical protein